MKDPFKERCRHCAYLVEGDHPDEWICADCDKEIHDIPDAECSAEEFEG